MNKRLKIVVLLVIILGLVSIGGYILYYFYQSSQKLHAEQAEVLSQQKSLAELGQKQKQQEALMTAQGIQSNGVMDLQKKVDAISEKLEETREKTLNVILKEKK